MTTNLRIERADHEQTTCCFNFNALIEQIINAIRTLWNACFGQSTDEGIPSVRYAEKPIEIRSRDIMSFKAIEHTPPRWLNQVYLHNESGTDIGFVEVLALTEKEGKTLLKTDMQRSQLTPLMSATVMQTSYQLEILVSRTADCSVPLEATDPFLIEGSYRNKMAEVLWDYHSTVEKVEGAEELYDALIRVGSYTLSDTLPAPLLEQLRDLEDDYQVRATTESVKDASETHRQSIRERADTARLVTQPIQTKGITHITVHEHQVEVEFQGEGKSFKQKAKFA